MVSLSSIHYVLTKNRIVHDSPIKKIHTYSKEKYIQPKQPKALTHPTQCIYTQTALGRLRYALSTFDTTDCCLQGYCMCVSLSSQLWYPMALCTSTLWLLSKKNNAETANSKWQIWHTYIYAQCSILRQLVLKFLYLSVLFLPQIVVLNCRILAAGNVTAFKTVSKVPKLTRN